MTNLPYPGLWQIKDQVNPMWTIYNTLELDSECGFYSLIRLFQLTMSVSDPWLITKVNDTGLTPRQLLICLLLNVIVISWLYIKNVGHILSYIYTTHASRHCRDPPHTVIFFWYSACALYQFCFTNFRVSLPPPPFYKRKKLKYVPSENVPKNTHYKYKIPYSNV